LVMESYNINDNVLNTLDSDVIQDDLFKCFFDELGDIESGFDSLDSIGESSCGSSPSSPIETTLLLKPIKPDPEEIPTKSPNIKKKRKTTKRNDSRTSKKQRINIKKEEEIKTEFSNDPKPEKNKKRLEANKKSAQASRERKKILKNELEITVKKLSEENKDLNKEIIELQTENKVLKGEFIQLQRMISQSPMFGIPSKGPSGEIGQTFSGAAFMYLIIVLQSFSQHFLSQLQTTNIPLEIANNTIICLMISPSNYLIFRITFQIKKQYRHINNTYFLLLF